MNKKFVLIPLVLVFITFFSCSDDPSKVGLGLLEQDYLKIDTLNSVDAAFPQTSSFFKKVISLGTSSKLLVGKKNNVTAHSLLKFDFSLPDSIKEDFRNNAVTITESYIELNPKYYYTDSLAVFDYKVYKINSNWTSTSFTADSFPSLSVDMMDLAQSKQFDSLYTFRFNPTLAREWVNYSLNPDSVLNYGILISPDDGAQKIVGFEAFNVSGTDDPKVKIIISKPGVYTDTITGFVTSDVSVVLGDNPAHNPDELLIQSSVALNAKINFDLSSLPKNIVINKVTLTLTTDTTKNVFGSSFDNSLTIYRVTDTTEVFSARISSIGNKYKGEITGFREWIKKSDNLEMIIKSGNEFIGTELFYIKGSDDLNPANRPYLEILFTYL